MLSKASTKFIGKLTFSVKSRGSSVLIKLLISLTIDLRGQRRNGVPNRSDTLDQGEHMWLELLNQIIMIILENLRYFIHYGKMTSFPPTYLNLHKLIRGDVTIQKGSISMSNNTFCNVNSKTQLHHRSGLFTEAKGVQTLIAVHC